MPCKRPTGKSRFEDTDDNTVEGRKASFFSRWKIMTKSNAILAACLLFLFSGCCSFEREWREAANRPGQGGIDGRWQGTWLSHSNGHKGGLRAIITPTGPGEYRARYHATFLSVIPFGYTTHLKTQCCNGSETFAGQADLGCMAGGVYRYSGSADHHQYRANYRSKKDCGVYSMTRVAADPCAEF